MSCNNYVEEFISLQEKIPPLKIRLYQKQLIIADKMVINEDDIHVELKPLYIDLTETFMSNHVGTLLEMKGCRKPFIQRQLYKKEG